MYPNTFYRVSVKALIRDEGGRVLVMKENQDTWSLPGGGLNHGEYAIDGVRRELKEELDIDDANINEVFCVKTLNLVDKKAWFMWIVYKVKLNDINFHFGDGVTEVQFMDPELLSSSDDIFEKMVYEVATEK